MLAAGLSLQVVCASAAVRTVETAVIVGGLVAPDLEARFADRLYLAAPGAIWDEAVRLRKEDGAVLIVGHNPGLHELVAELIGRSGERSALARTLLIDLPTAAWIAFEVQDDDLKSTSVRILGGWTPSRSD